MEFYKAQTPLSAALEAPQKGRGSKSFASRTAPWYEPTTVRH